VFVEAGSLGALRWISILILAVPADRVRAFFDFTPMRLQAVPQSAAGSPPAELR